MERTRKLFVAACCCSLFIIFIIDVNIRSRGSAQVFVTQPAFSKVNITITSDPAPHRDICNKSQALNCSKSACDVFAPFKVNLTDLDESKSIGDTCATNHCWTRANRTISKCNWEAFRKYQLQHEYFPGQGHWELEQRNYSVDTFVPEMCHFDNRILQSSKLLKCLRENKWHKIVTTGDSNGYRNFLGVRYWLEMAFPKCKLIRKETRFRNIFMPDIRYFTKGRKDLERIFRIHKRLCHSCKSTYVSCQFPAANKNQESESPKPFILEHLATSGIVDTSVITLNITQHTTNPIPPTSSMQEYIFRSHLKKELPDILIIILPFIHELATKLSEALQKIKELSELVRKYIPLNVKVVWVPQTKIWAFSKPIYEGMGANTKAKKMNEALFNQIKPLIVDRASNWYGFYDLQSVACPLRFLSSDGLHMSPEYYKVLMGQLLQLMCGEKE